MDRQRSSFLSNSALPGALIGILAFFVVMPANVLDPANIGWLGLHEDTKTYYLAWDYFRRLPWGIPISFNAQYGIEIAASVFMADVVPLVAIPLKLLAPILGDVFQYHGLWLLLCFALQGFFAWKIASLLTNVSIHKALICSLFVFQMIFINRASTHLPLMAHFFVLASFYVCLCGDKSFSPAWLAIIAGAACTNAYLLVMTLVLWFADFVRRAVIDRRVVPLVCESVLIALVVGFFCWQVGYFSVGSGVRAAGLAYGLYRFNLLSFFDPNNWSILLKDIPSGPGDAEGFAYLGLGIFLLLLASALPLLSRGKGESSHGFPGNRYLYIAVVALALYSVTSHIGIGPYTFVVPLPDGLTGILSVFRGAGRFVWPVVYAGLVIITFLICKNFRARGATVLFACALGVQLVDSSAGWLPIRTAVQQAAASSWSSPLKSAFWEEAAGIYRTVRRVPAINAAPGWEIFATYADSQKMATDSVYLARVDYRKLSALNAETELRIAQGRYDAQTLYVISDRYVGKAALGIDSQRDLMTEVDGYVVVAPNWATRKHVATPPMKALNYLPPPIAGSSYPINRPTGVEGRSLVEGWSTEIGSGGVWSEGPKARVRFPVPDLQFGTVDFVGMPLLGVGRSVLKVIATVNGGPAEVHQLDGSIHRLSLRLTEADRLAIARDKALDVTLEFPNPMSPRDLQINADARLLSFALQSINFH